MERIRLDECIGFNDQRFSPKVLIHEPGYRMVVLSIRQNQSVPEHRNPGIVTVYAVRGHITFYEGQDSCELRAGEVVRIPANALHRIEAHADSVLFVLATGGSGSSNESQARSQGNSEDRSEELDIREIPRPQRHPLIFQKFDALPVGSSLRLINDHDPVPLSRQFESMRPGQAHWEYIERGPALFHIRIRRVAPGIVSCQAGPPIS